MMASGEWRHCTIDGYRVPEDVSVIGCDDIDFAGFPQISLTTNCPARIRDRQKSSENAFSGERTGTEQNNLRTIFEDQEILPGIQWRIRCFGGLKCLQRSAEN